MTSLYSDDLIRFVVARLSGKFKGGIQTGQNKEKHIPDLVKAEWNLDRETVPLTCIFFYGV
jgi:hypothetical protein